MQIVSSAEQRLVAQVKHGSVSLITFQLHTDKAKLRESLKIVRLGM